ncbi:hypothetical protein [Pseudomonas sp. C11]|uniref:hypothetical protein n=1 Tax=Pseudomonas sp. C11 TaxID=3075550 RepID=UPI002AFFCBDE|nr:hypothetical protein [Pseudomonas sp. C11]
MQKMQYGNKKSKISLFISPKDIKNTHLNKDSYKIIHPNFERYEDFIVRTQQQHGAAVLVKFTPLNESPKTEFTFNFFKLKDLELNTFDTAQGLSTGPWSQKLLLDALRAEVENQPDFAEEILKLLTATAIDE